MGLKEEWAKVSDLQLCPKCGKEPWFECQYDGGDDCMVHYIECSGCSARTTMSADETEVEKLWNSGQISVPE